MLKEKELLLDYSAIVHIFDEWYYFSFYTLVQNTRQYVTINSYNYIFIASHGSVHFWTVLLAGLLTVILYNIFISLVLVKIVDGGLYFIFPFHFILFFLISFLFLFLFLFLEQLRLGFISHAVISVTNWWRSHKTDHET